MSKGSKKDDTFSLDPERIIKIFKERRSPLFISEISNILNIERSQRKSLRRILRSLIREGKIVRFPHNRYGIPNTSDLVIGRVKCHPDGYGFVIPENKDIEDIFINPKDLKEVMDGDRVAVRLESRRRKKRGKIVKIIERKTCKIVGKFVKERHGLYVIPENGKTFQKIYIQEKDSKRAKPNQIVVAEITQYPTKSTPPKGRITNILGYHDDPEIEPQIIIHKYDLPLRFSPSALKQAKNVPLNLSSEDYHGRVDLRWLPTVTIDGEKAMDFDDAVSIREKNGGVILYVSISDVSHYVEENSFLDEEAYLRGTSVYFPDQAIQMFPPELSNEICCLKPRVDRLAVTVEIEFDKNGEKKDVRFYPSIIRSSERLTYTIGRSILIDKDPDLRRKFNYLIPPLEKMLYLSQMLRQKRLKRGALDFDLPEPEVILNLQGEAEDIIRVERNIAHQIIEEFMIAANEAVAEFLEGKGIPSIYRIHEPPEKESIDEFKRFLNYLGYKMRRDSKLSSRDLQKVLNEVKGKPEERVVNEVLLRSMRWAKYSAKNLGHFGLASEAYTHFTSPIRRYPDLIVHRILKAVLNNRKIDISEEMLSKKADHLSQRERIAMEAEREILDRYRVRYMRGRIGEEFDGVICGVVSFGFFVELEDIFVKGLVKINTLDDDYYRFNEDKYCLIGERTKNTFRIGDKVRVRLIKVDIEKRQIDFILLKRLIN